MQTQTIHYLGFWSAALAFGFSLTFVMGALMGLPKPWDVYIPIGASLLLALTFVILLVTVHAATPNAQKLWSHLGMAFALLYATLVSIVYVTWLFVVEPRMLRGEANEVALLIFAPGSFLQMLDGLGYCLMMLAALFTGLAFSKRGLENWIRWVGVANGVFALPVFFSYVSNNLFLGLWWGITIPAFLLLLAIFYWRTEPTKIPGG